MLVREIADDSSQGRRELLDERRCSENLVILGLLWVLEDVDDLQLVLATKLAIADASQVGDGDLGF